MPLNREEKTKKLTRDKSIRESRFDIEEYLQHPPLISNLYRDYKSLQGKYNGMEVRVKLVEDTLNAKDTELKVMRLKLRVLRERLEEREKQGLLKTVLALVMTLLFGFGVNIVSATPSYAWIGWVMIGIAGMLQFLDLLIGLTRKSRKNDWIDEQD